jgi:hypothetical protein
MKRNGNRERLATRTTAQTINKIINLPNHIEVTNAAIKEMKLKHITPQGTKPEKPNINPSSNLPTPKEIQLTMPNSKSQLKGVHHESWSNLMMMKWEYS